MRSVADAVQVLNLILSIGALVLLLWSLWRWPKLWRVVVLPLSYAVLSVGFYVATLLNALPGPWASLLSAMLRLYSYVLMGAIGGVAIYVAIRHEHGERAR